jgi:hypothetical protein
VCGRDKRRQRNAGTPTAIFAAGAKKSKWWKGVAEQSGGGEGVENRGVEQREGITRETKPAGKRLAVRRRRPEPSRVSSFRANLQKERNAVVETRSVSVTPRRLRCRPSTTGCYRPPRSSLHARISSSIFTNDYACLLPLLHITRPSFVVSRTFPIVLPSEACSIPLFRFYRLFRPSHASSFTTLHFLL